MKSLNLGKEIEKDTRIWKELPYSWICRIHIIANLPNPIYRFSTISLKISTSLFT